MSKIFCIFVVTKKLYSGEVGVLFHSDRHFLINSPSSGKSKLCQVNSGKCCHYGQKNNIYIYSVLWLYCSITDA